VFDRHLRGFKDRSLDAMAGWVGRYLSPGALTWIGLGFGLASAWASWRGIYDWGFLLFGFNRLMDGLDGAAARIHGRSTDFGGLLDILFDFIAYAAVAVGLALSRPEAEGVLPAALFMMAAFYVNAAAWMYLSAVLEKRAMGASHRGERTTVAMPEGFIGGTESMLVYAAFFFIPGHLRIAFGAFAVMVGLTIVQRLIWAKRALG
jgi:phosphatidylglycerophosphate synthase